MILLISISFPIPFCSLHLSSHSFILSFYRILYNLYLNPNLLKILPNYTYTIPKVTTLHTYILTFCLIFLYTFLPFLYSFSYSPSYISISFIFPLCISILLSYFSYTLSYCAQIDLTIFGYFILLF